MLKTLDRIVFIDMIDIEKHISSAPLYTYRRPHPRFAKSIAFFAVCLLCLVAFEHTADAINREEMLNPFVRPNVHSEAYYGSGDADENSVVNWDDLDLMKKGKVSDYTDINGDGITNNEDISILESYLNNEIPNLPGDWNRLEILEQKDDWYTKMNSVEKLEEDAIRLISERNWLCGDFSMQYFTNFFGIKRLMNGWETRLSDENNSRFNIPVYIAEIGKQGFSNSINAILIGNNPLNFNNWKFIEPQNGRVVQVGDFSMPENSTIILKGLYDEGLNGEGPDMFEDYVIAIRLEGKNPVVIWQNPQLRLTNQPDGLAVEDNDANKNETFPVINYPNPFNMETTIHYTLRVSEHVNLSIYNTVGQKVETLIQSRHQAGSYSIVWNAGIYPSGIYVYRLQAGKNCATGTMTLVK